MLIGKSENIEYDTISCLKVYAFMNRVRIWKHVYQNHNSDQSVVCKFCVRSYHFLQMSERMN